MEKQVKKRSLYVPESLYDFVLTVRTKLQNDGDSDVTLTDTLKVMLEEAVKNTDRLKVRRPWSFDQFAYRLKQTKPEIFRGLLTKDNLKTIVELLEAKAKETDAAMESITGSTEPRRISRKRKKNQTPNESQSNPDGEPVSSPTVAEGVANSAHSAPSGIRDS